MFPSVAAVEPDTADLDIAAILDMVAEDMPRPVVAPEHPNAKAARETRDAASRTREWRQRQREAADVNAAIADALVTADWRHREAERLAGRHKVVVPVDLGAVTVLARESLRRQGYDAIKTRDLLVARLSPTRPPTTL